ncbi:hypothetical protein [Martelella radicis]|uniref:Uncharacterized protein n=1 Tax=Martelella radicis TaxID=1397476 RepID=A0A7W6PBC6_9HYPH|nr:hypothetical protein [Martelella radicis]MBB4124327.1 hypothetical protein [Martelella radicis]
MMPIPVRAFTLTVFARQEGQRHKLSETSIEVIQQLADSQQALSLRSVIRLIGRAEMFETQPKLH